MEQSVNKTGIRLILTVFILSFVMLFAVAFMRTFFFENKYNSMPLPVKMLEPRDFYIPYVEQPKYKL